MKQYLKSYVKVNKQNGSFEVTASTADVDRDGEIIDPKGWDIANYLKNPVILYAHDYSSLPIGKAENVEIQPTGLYISGKFASSEANPMAQKVRLLYEEGILNAVSVGFIPKLRDGNTITKAELLELSFVPVPSNPNALAMAISKGLDISILKGAVASHDTPMAPEDMAWDSTTAIMALRTWAGGPEPDGIDWGKYKEGFAWYDGANAENLGSYKLPHHDIVDGGFKVVWRGVASAMGVLLGSMGGVDVPEEDRQGIYNHLKRHYEQFNKDVPEMRAYSDEELDKLFHAEQKQDFQGIVDDHFSELERDLNMEVRDLIDEHKRDLTIDLERELGDWIELSKEIKQTQVQSVILSKEQFPTLDEAKRWINDHNFHDAKYDETETSWRFRQFEPTECVEGSFRTIEMTTGVSAVICVPQEGKICQIPEIKTGRVLSNKNRGLIKDVVEKMGDTISVLTELLEITEPTKTVSVGESGGRNLPVEEISLRQEDVEELRQKAKRDYKNNELILTITKRVLAQK
jgi:HK97 family phage prohead protease